MRWATLTAAILLATLSVPASAESQWTPFEGGPATGCADGSRVGFLERIADPTRVVLYFEGGGACFSADTCDFDGPNKTYVSSTIFTARDLDERGGLFDLDDPANPIGGHSWVYVPYCTGDAHLGARTTRYSEDVVVEHRGAVNARAALDHLVASYPDVDELAVIGASAGSIPTPLYAALASERLPDARIVTLADSSGAYPSDPVLNGLIGSLWGTMDAAPEWPVIDDLTVRDWGIPDLYLYAGAQAPRVVFGKFDHAYDEVQVFYAGLVGVPADALVTLIDGNEAGIEAADVEVASFVAPGTDHTIVGSDALYTLEVDGVRFVDWLDGLFVGDPPADVHCGDRC